MRFALPAAYADPAFIVCLHESIGTLELVNQFDRLYGANLSRKPSERDMAAFTAFVHDSVYTRLPDEALDSLRAAALKAGA